MRALIQRDVRRRLVFRRTKNKREALRGQIRDVNVPTVLRHKAIKRLACLKRDGIGPRMRNRCPSTGRSRGVVRDFKLSRTVLRGRILNGSIPGVYKSSW
jgi:small subunit ribosomal protein S14